MLENLATHISQFTSQVNETINLNTARDRIFMELLIPRAKELFSQPEMELIGSLRQSYQSAVPRIKKNGTESVKPIIAELDKQWNTLSTEGKIFVEAYRTPAIAYSFYRERNYDKAKELLEKTIEIAKILYGKGYNAVFTHIHLFMLGHLSEIDYSCGKYDEGDEKNLTVLQFLIAGHYGSYSLTEANVDDINKHLPAKDLTLVESFRKIAYMNMQYLMKDDCWNGYFDNKLFLRLGPLTLHTQYHVILNDWLQVITLFYQGDRFLFIERCVAFLKQPGEKMFDPLRIHLIYLLNTSLGEIQFSGKAACVTKLKEYTFSCLPDASVVDFIFREKIMS